MPNSTPPSDPRPARIELNISRLLTGDELVVRAEYVPAHTAVTRVRSIHVELVGPDDADELGDGLIEPAPVRFDLLAPFVDEVLVASVDELLSDQDLSQRFVIVAIETATADNCGVPDGVEVLTLLEGFGWVLKEWWRRQQQGGAA